MKKYVMIAAIAVLVLFLSVLNNNEGKEMAPSDFNKIEQQNLIV